MSTLPTKTIWVWKNAVVHNLVLPFHPEFLFGFLYHYYNKLYADAIVEIPKALKNYCLLHVLFCGNAKVAGELYSLHPRPNQLPVQATSLSSCLGGRHLPGDDDAKVLAGQLGAAWIQLV